MTRRREILEAAWFVATACIALLFLLLLHRSSLLMEAHLSTGRVPIPPAFWVLSGVILALCAAIPYLLRQSWPLDFRVIAILLTAVAPAVATAWLVLNLWQVTRM